MTTGLVLGVDPGKSGALALVDGAGEPLVVEDMPTVEGAALGTALGMFLDDIRPDVVSVAYVESQTVRPRQAGMTQFITNFGALLGAFGALRIPTVLVTPGAWKVAAGLRGKDKAASRSLAMTLWPAWSESFARVRDDGRAEACLIARHGWQEVSR